MFFHPLTFEPGPVATVIGLALIVCLVAQPLVFRPLFRAARRPAPADGSSPLVRLYRATVWWYLGEMFVGMVFVGTASAVTPADIGLSLPAFHGFADRPGLLAVVLCGAAFLALRLFPMALQAWVLWRYTGWTLRGEAQAGLSRATVALLPENVAERRAAVLSSLTWLLGWTVSVHWVVIPLLTSGFGLSAWNTFVTVCLLTLWGASNTGWRGAATTAFVGATATGWYLFVFVGSLLTPLLVWGLYVAVLLAALPYRGPDAAPEPVPDEPVMTWRLDDGDATPKARV
ncbi:hypothetical protein KIK06_06620 [Nocardiopsis sp. EMB25]|uniref:hypothetical protein n=1 Tax=Nocardiopsis sp. EMB25 TaxID=2835867 RepID=UPI002284975F|nr:hypothetical protein [Nocardiopsis sp. EMB25]MCY9783566.1 hypothetical protein [Nocardiopsis sp. EMB25]